jgi:hypothetical protein
LPLLVSPDIRRSRDASGAAWQDHKDAVIVAAADADWRGGVERFLRELGGDPAKIGRHLELLGERAAGHRPWGNELADRLLANGRPMPPARAYAEMLVTESILPLYDAGGIEDGLTA